MLTINFHEKGKIKNEDMTYAVVVSTYRDKLAFVKQKTKNTFEVPGGTREKGERILDTAHRELYEETGATEYQLEEVCPYSVNRDGVEKFGTLYRAVITIFGPLPDFEMEKVAFFDNLPKNLTYPDIQPTLIEKALAKNM